jgi:hypothetical protein
MNEFRDISGPSSRAGMLVGQTTGLQACQQQEVLGQDFLASTTCTNDPRGL